MDALDLLAGGRMTIKGRLPSATNATFLVECELDGTRDLGVYKPGGGERPLWDFPPALYKREVAAYLLSEALGWGIVPATLVRDGPLGEGSLQRFIDADFEQHYFTLRAQPEQRAALERVCAFDVVANNADRKAGHCLIGKDGRIYAIDNGLCFHAERKLRTVIWDFGGEPIPEAIVADVRRLVDSGLPAALEGLLAPEERRALRARARALVKHGRFPEDHGFRSYPWPLV